MGLDSGGKTTRGARGDDASAGGAFRRPGLHSKEEEMQKPAARIATPASLAELVELAGADDVLELHMEGVDLGEPVALSKFDHQCCPPLAKQRGCEVLALTYCSLEAGSVHKLAAALRHHTTLRRLFLRGNAIRSQGAQLMAKALRGNDVLQVVELDENGIGPDFPTGLLRALPSLLALNLYGNEIRELPQAIIDDPHATLEDLDLRANGLRQDALPAKIPPRWMLDGQRDHATIKKYRLKPRTTLY